MKFIVELYGDILIEIIKNLCLIKKEIDKII